MNTPDIRNTMKQTFKALKLAENELNRPKEDVVTMSICYSLRQAMDAMMRMFLFTKGVNAPSSLGLADLLKLCKEKEKQFSSINLTPILCSDSSYKECDGKYCMDTSKVIACLEVVKQLKLIMLEKLKMTEND